VPSSVIARVSLLLTLKRSSYGVIEVTGIDRVCGYWTLNTVFSDRNISDSYTSAVVARARISCFRTLDTSWHSILVWDRVLQSTGSL